MRFARSEFVVAEVDDLGLDARTLQDDLRLGGERAAGVKPQNSSGWGH